MRALLLPLLFTSCTAGSVTGELGGEEPGSFASASFGRASASDGAGERLTLVDGAALPSACGAGERYRQLAYDDLVAGSPSNAKLAALINDTVPVDTWFMKLSALGSSDATTADPLATAATVSIVGGATDNAFQLYLDICHQARAAVADPFDPGSVCFDPTGAFVVGVEIGDDGTIRTFGDKIDFQNETNGDGGGTAGFDVTFTECAPMSAIEQKIVDE